MIVTPLIRKSASRAYAGLRIPFAVVESRLPESSRVRSGLHAALRTMDSSLGRLTRPPAEESEPRPGRTTQPAEPAAPAQEIEAEREAIAEAVRERQPDVGELADPNLDVAEVQAQLQAKHAVEERVEAEQARGSSGRRPT